MPRCARLLSLTLFSILILCSHLSAQSVSLSSTSLSFGNQVVNTASATVNVTLTNTGSALLTLSISITGNYAQTNTCGSSVAAGKKCIISVTFTPTVTGTRTGTVTITDNASNSPQTISLTGTGVLAVSLSATSLTFPNQVVGTTSTAQLFTLTNNQSVSLTITSIVATGDFAQTNTCGGSVTAKGKCTINITFTPTTTGTRTGAVTITDSANNSPQVISLSGTGTAVQLTGITLTPNSPLLPLGSTLQFTATGKYNNGTSQNLTNSVTWSSSSTKTATVNSTGLASSVAQGTATIKAVSGTISATTTLTVTAPALVSIAVTPANPTIPVTTTQQFTATGTYTNNTTQNLTNSATWSSSNTGVATVGSTGLASSKAQGSTTITATVGTVSGSTMLTVRPPALVSIAVTPTSPSIALGTSQQFTATGTYADGSTANITTQVIWSSSTANATVSNSAPTQGLAQSVAVGSSAITATSGTISGATTLTVGPAVLVSLAITPANPAIALGTTQQLSATGTYSDGSTQNLTTSVTWNSSNTGAATISNNPGSQGLASSAATGTTTITAISGSVSTTTVLTVTPAVLVSIAITPAIPSIPLGTTQLFTATGTFTDGSTQNITQTVQWSSATTGVATISNASGTQGLATSVASGSTTITATSGSISGSTTLTVTAAALVSIAVTPANPAIALGTTQQFSATGTYSDGSTQNLTNSAIWASSTNVATISATGLATTVAAGSATVTATSGSIVGSTTLTVSPATLVSITVAPANPTIALGTTQQFTATGTYSDGSTQDVTASTYWTSSVLNVATISDSAPTIALATSTGTGTTTIMAASGSITGSANLTVTAAALVSISVTPANPSIALGATEQFTATGTFTDGSTQNLTNTATWSSSSTTVAVISNSAGSQGLATSAAVGTTTITAASGSVTSSTTLTVGNAQLVSIAVTPANPSVPQGGTQQFTATGTYSDGSTQNLTNSATWSSSNPAVASINANGEATGLAGGTSTISGVSGTISGSTTLTVTASGPVLTSISITPTNPSVAAGTMQQFTATGTYSDGSTQNLTTWVSWTSSNAAVATISNASGTQGLATGLTQGTSTITATSGSISGSSVLTVTPASLVSIAVTPVNPSIALGTTQQFTATGTYSDGGTQNLTTLVTWSSSTTTVATISNVSGNQGLATTVATGTTTITATSGPVSGSASLTVGPSALVSIAVTPPDASIAVGTSQQFTSTGTYGDGGTSNITSQVTWSSSSTDASISNTTGTQGLAQSVTVGSSTVTATLNSITGSTLLNITPVTLVSIAVSPTTPTLDQGLKQQFTAMGTFTDGSNQDLTATATWSSSATTVATISNAPGTQGQATTVLHGSTVITATSGSVVSNAADLSVEAPTLISIAVNPANPSLAFGTAQQFSATGSYTDGSTQDLTTSATWNSSATNIATISNATGSAGLASSTGQGSTTITAISSSVSGNTLLTVTAAELISINVNPAVATIPLGATQQFTALGTFSDQTTQDLTATVHWAADPGSVATVSNSAPTQGLATSIMAGNVAVSATSDSISGSAALTVSPATLVSLAVTPGNASIATGTSQQFTATGTYSDDSTKDLTTSVSWSTSPGGIVNISNAIGSQGMATAVNQGMTTVTATFGSVNGSTSLAVTAATLVSIAITPANPTLSLGFRQQFTATGTYSDSSTQNITNTAQWTTNNASVASVNATGLATAISPGTVTVTATLNSVTASTTLAITVAKITAINDLGTNNYSPGVDSAGAPCNGTNCGVVNFQGGLYPSGLNSPPSAQNSDALTFAGQIHAIQSTKTVIMMCIGMSIMKSNCDQMVHDYKISANTNQVSLFFFDMAQSGYNACEWITASGTDCLGNNNPYDTIRDIYLPAIKVCGNNHTSACTEADVQVVFYQDAEGAPQSSLPCTGSGAPANTGFFNASGVRMLCSGDADAYRLEIDLAKTARAVKTRYPNCKLMFISTRNYGGYATTAQDPEPYAYDQGFGMKAALVAQETQCASSMSCTATPGDSNTGDLSYVPTPGNACGGSPCAPELLWASYTWANGTTARSDGLIWCNGQAGAPCNGEQDFSSDGTHASAVGDEKWASETSAWGQIHFFLNSPYSNSWFHK